MRGGEALSTEGRAVFRSVTLALQANVKAKHLRLIRIRLGDREREVQRDRAQGGDCDGVTLSALALSR